MIYLMCGLPGSGKSTWAREKVNNSENTIIVNRDSIRSMIAGKYEFNIDTENLVKSIARSSVQLAIDRNFDVIIDETNINKINRYFWLNICEEQEVICVHCTETEDNIKYVQKRGIILDTWDQIIQKMKNSFEIPEENEGFNEIISINPIKNKL